MSGSADDIVDSLIIGAGLAGLVTARVLAQAGRTVRLIDKGPSVGGRLATRRIGEARLDHGAQFFTVRTEAFGSLVADAVAAGVAYEWCRGFGSDGDGFPRYACHGGMNALAKWLATGHDVCTRQRVETLEVLPEGWQIRTASGQTHGGRSLVLTSPVPQSLALVDGSGLGLSPALDTELRAVEYFATLALLATLDGPPAIPEPGAVQLDQTEPFTFVADNARKGISPTPAITLHANHELSLRRFDDEDDIVQNDLIELARPWIGDAAVIESQLKKWRYAGPIRPIPASCRVDDVAGATVVFAGDAFGGPKVEGAACSGFAAASAVLGA